MVNSFLTVYVITFSSAVLLTTSHATTSPAQIYPSAMQNEGRDIEINFHDHVRTNGSANIAGENITGEHKRNSKKPKALEASRVPYISPRASNLTGHFNATRPYLALYDPVNNVTVKVELSRQNPTERRSDKPSDDLLLIPGQPVSDESSERASGQIKNFIEWDTLRDSEKEVRIHYNGITAKETSVRTGTDEDTGKRQGLKLRQLTDGKHFIQLIYNFENEIQDCEYIRQKSVVEKFLRAFRGSVENAKRTYERTAEEKNFLGEEEEDEDDYLEDDEGKIEKYSLDDEVEQYEGEDMDFGQEYRNVTFQIIRRDTDVPKELAEWMNYPRLKRQCRENHKILKRLAFNRKHGDKLAKKLAEEHIERVKRNLDFSLIFPGTKWCGKSHIAEKYTSLGGFSKTDKCCRTHDHCHPLISAFEEKYGFYNFRPFTVSHCRCDLRRKRDIMDVLLVPGTKWCGKGRRATKYTSLGGFSRTDKCCRVHDTMCPHWIGSLEEKYGLFNWRINTIMHCRCDKRFRACLKMAKTGTANFVGKLFFNVVQTKCFVLKPQEVCLKYSWWGTCEKMEFRKKAYLKDNLSY